MKSILKKMNRQIMGFISHLDSDPEKARPVTFWFYSENEGKIYRLAARLQQNGYKIKYCKFSDAYSHFLCIAERTMVAEFSHLNRLCIDMQILAEKMDVEFDGWETVIEP